MDQLITIFQTGMPCFTAYKVAWFHSSTGEHIRCHCDLSSLKEIPLFSALLTWDCDHLMATTTPTPAVIYVTVTPPKIVDSPKFTIRSDPTTKSSLDFDYDVFNLRPKEKEENVEHISTSTQKSEGFGLNDETKNMCNYCVQNWPDDSYKCIPATTLECLTEIKKYEGEQIPVNCMSDYARVYTSKERKACLVEMETQRIYMIFFV